MAIDDVPLAPVPEATFIRVPPHSALAELVTLMRKLSELKVKVNVITLIVRVVT